MILSTGLVESVVVNHQLSKKWNLTAKQSAERILEMSKVTPRRGTNFIEIKVGSHDQEEAKLLSDALTDSYVARKNKNAESRKDAALKTLDDELKRHGDLVDEKHLSLTILSQQLKLPHFKGRTDQALETLPEEEILQKAKLILAELKKDSPELNVLDDETGEFLKDIYWENTSMMQHKFKSAIEEYEQTRDLYREMKLLQKEQRDLLNSDQKTVTRVE